MSHTVLAELRRRYPGKGRAADHENGRAAAVWLFCVHCQGGDRAAATACNTQTCPLWLYRPMSADSKRVRGLGVVPSVEEYNSMTESSGDGGAALRRWREGEDTKTTTQEEAS